VDRLRGLTATHVARLIPSPAVRDPYGPDSDPSTLNNLRSRPQSSNAAFTFGNTYPFTECFEAPGEPFSEYCTDYGALPGISNFQDSKGWYPGIEVRGTTTQPRFFYKDIDASVVIPSAGNQPYSVRVTDSNSNLLPEWFGADLGLGQPLGTGNPGDDGVAMGVGFQLVQHSKDNTWAIVTVTPPQG
jgi:immune inhibitor A